jgi:hypothetical protein
MQTAEFNTLSSPNRLLEFVERMSLPDLDRFLWQVIILRSRRRVPHLSAKESKLLLQINKGLPVSVQTKLNHLVAKRRAGTLTADEHNVLLGLIDKLENAEAQRVKALGELAHLRGVSVKTLMKQLGIRAPYPFLILADKNGLSISHGTLISP